MVYIKDNLFLFLAFLIFLILTLPFVNIIPYLDGNIDFVQTLDFYSGGLNQYFNNWNTVHPPLKLFLTFPFYKILGISPISYSIPGVLLGLLGIVSIYSLVRELFDKESGRLSALIFSTYPLIISNSIFLMRDFMLTLFIVTSLSFYLKKKYFLYAIFAVFALLTKETGLLLVCTVLLVEITFLLIKKGHKIKERLLNLAFIFLPLIIYYFWTIILKSADKTSWNEWIFSDSKSKGAVGTIINNIISGEIFNPYAYAHWKQLFFLNFNWVYLIFILLSLIYFFGRNRKLDFLKNEQKLKTFSIIFIISFLYLITVLSLQTYTIPRYALPIIPFLIIGLAKSISVLKSGFKQLGLIILAVLIIFSLFSSIDPVASEIFGDTKVQNQKIYALNENLAGNDGITYNAQYLILAKKRSDALRKANKNNSIVRSDDCRWTFPDPSNETKTLKALSLNLELYCQDSLR